MKKVKLITSLSLLGLFALASCSVTATKGEKGDTGATGPAGTQGEAGHSPQITIGSNGNWFIDGVDQNVKAGSTEEVYNDTLPEKAAGLSFSLTLTSEGYSYCVTNLIIKDDTEGVYVPKTFKGIPVTAVSIPDSGYVGEDSQIKWLQFGNNIKYLNFDRVGDVDELYYDGTISNWCNLIGDYVRTKKFYTLDSSGDISFNNNKYSLCKNITIPGDVKEIKRYTFRYIDSLETVTIEEGVQVINNYAFNSCSNLKNVSIPNSIISMGEEPFYGCDNLTYNELNNGYYLGNSTNQYLVLAKTKNDTYTSFEINKGCKFIFRYAFRDRKIISITVPNGITSLASSTFESCSNLESVSLPNNIKEIGSSCFQNCRKLSTINIPQGCEKLGNDTFYNCEKLETITIPSSIKSINTREFYCCTSLSEIILSEGLKTIDPYAFAYTAITSITIPSTVTSLSDAIFDHCGNLTTINYNGTKAQWANVYKTNDWNYGVSVTEVVCTDGNISLI